MTRRQWLASLRRRGARLSLEGDGYVRLRGHVTAADRRRLEADRRGVVRLLRQRQARQIEKAVVGVADLPMGSGEHEQVVVGERISRIGGAYGERRVEPIYGPDRSPLPGRLLFQRLQEQQRGE